jgi:phosphotransferase system HPr (HPr) family protein
MNGPSLQQKVTIANPLGFHLRPMAAFARQAAQYQSTITLTNGSRRVSFGTPGRHPGRSHHG